MNSKIMDYNLEIQNPTLNFQPGDIGALPIIKIPEKGIIKNLSKKNIQLAKEDWDSFESSRGFIRHPLIPVYSI